jgi:hypothetical protein
MKHEQADANLAEQPERAERRRGKNKMKKVRPHPAKQRRPQQNARYHLTHHGRLADSLRQHAAPACRQEDQNQLDEQSRERVLQILAQILKERCGGFHPRNLRTGKL